MEVTNFEVGPITGWMLLTVRCDHADTLQTYGIFQLIQQFYSRLHLAALLLWPTDPSASEVQAAEQAMGSYYGPLLANGSN